MVLNIGLWEEVALPVALGVAFAFCVVEEGGGVALVCGCVCCGSAAANVGCENSLPLVMMLSVPRQSTRAQIHVFFMATP